MIKEKKIKKDIQVISEQEEIEDTVTKKEIPYTKNFESGGQKFLFVVVCALLIGLAFPVIAIYFVKSPQINEHFVIFGVSYFKLVFIFFVSTAVISYSFLFFLRVKPLIIVFAFIISLFSCFPFIVALKNNFTFDQSVNGISFFMSWPFYLRPAYLLVEFVIPIGLILALLLQFKNMFFAKQKTYIFMFAGLYLCAALVLGFTTLSKAGQPTIFSYLSKERHSQLKNDNKQYKLTLANNLLANKSNKAKMTFKIPDHLKIANQKQVKVNGINPKKIKVKPFQNQSEKVSNKPVYSSNIDKRLNSLSEKMDKILDKIVISKFVNNNQVNQNYKQKNNINQNSSSEINKQLEDLPVVLRNMSDVLSLMEKIILKQKPDYNKKLSNDNVVSNSDPKTGSNIGSEKVLQKTKTLVKEKIEKNTNQTYNKKTMSSIGNEIKMLSAKVDYIWKVLQNTNESK